MAREIVFKMERPGLVEEGQEVEVSESVTPFNVNYHDRTGCGDVRTF